MNEIYQSKQAPRDEVSIYFPNMEISAICHDYVFALLFGI
jgi:hypothetical protein